MISSIIWLILNCATYFLSKYCLDRITFPNGKADPSPPSVYDLNSDASRYVIDKYTQDVIIPLSDYKEYDRALSSSVDSGYALAFFFFEAVTLILGIKHLAHYFSIALFDGVSIFISYCLAIPLFSVICLLLWKLIAHLYRRLFSIAPFADSPKDLSSQIAGSKPDYPISDRQHLNNYIIQRYLDYYRMYAHKQKWRQSANAVVDVILCIVYVIFFFEAP